MKSVEGVIRWCFEDILKTFRPRDDQIELVSSFILIRVTREMNDKLQILFTAEEVRVSFFSMNPTKALVVDGIPFLFS